jgi:lysophospholipase L1-like esterase
VGGRHLNPGRPTFTSSGNSATCNDGRYGLDYWKSGFGGDNRWLAGAPAWCAVDLGATGATSVLVALSDENAGPDFLGSPGFVDYVVEVSPNSTDGRDGSWTRAVAVTGNAYLYREHRLAFAGQRWVRLTVAAPGAVSLDELDVWDVSTRPADALVWVGDSITARCSARAAGYGAFPSLQADVLAARAGHAVYQVGAGTRSVGTAWAVAGTPSLIARYLELLPDVTYWGIGLGTNDSGAGVSDAAFEANLRALVEAVLAAGHVPLLARIPYTADPSYAGATVRLNAVVDAVTARYRLPPGPDLYAVFQQHAGDYYDVGGDQIHPNKVGCTAWQQAWAETLAPLL